PAHSRERARSPRAAGGRRRACSRGDSRLGSVAATVVRYDAPGWGVGELWLEEGRPLWHELPRPDGSGQGSHPLADRLAAYFAGAPDSFDDVDVDLDDETDYGRELAAALRRI